MNKRKFYPSIAFEWNPYTSIEILGFIHWWKWYQTDRWGFTICIGYLVVMFGEHDPVLPFLDPPNFEPSDELDDDSGEEQAMYYCVNIYLPTNLQISYPESNNYEIAIKTCDDATKVNVLAQGSYNLIDMKYREDIPEALEYYLQHQGLKTIHVLASCQFKEILEFLVKKKYVT